ncbi:hypothetical protein EVAR_44889_1 [Eumeta japonica]|uniref:Uncharacterized protein n=1 Tax=Eumeta variegata TaxID=151549 RepID=A0A4C1XK40_EUMVA|nr:hypothetical protein EVAR_44889_1 [Eumeta japonica]
MYTYRAHALLTHSSDFRAARLNPCELRTVVPYTYTLSERSAELHGRRSGGVSCDQLYERVEHVGPLGRTEKSRANTNVSPNRITRAFRYDVIARNYSNVAKQVSLQ